MGFWDANTKGVGTPSKEWMEELMGKQQKRQTDADPLHLRMDAGDLSKQYSKDELGGHSAWIEDDWKLHRIVSKKSNKVTK